MLMDVVKFGGGAVLLIGSTIVIWEGTLRPFIFGKGDNSAVFAEIAKHTKEVQEALSELEKEKEKYKKLITVKQELEIDIKQKNLEHQIQIQQLQAVIEEQATLLIEINEKLTILMQRNISVEQNKTVDSNVDTNNSNPVNNIKEKFLNISLNFLSKKTKSDKSEQLNSSSVLPTNNNNNNTLEKK